MYNGQHTEGECWDQEYFMRPTQKIERSQQIIGFDMKIKLQSTNGFLQLIL